MAYFLKKSKIKKGTYLQIYESFYHHDKKQTSHRSYKAIGYVDDLFASGIDDPISFYTEEVKHLNADLLRQKKESEIKQIDKSPVRHLGYCLIKNILNGLNIEKSLNLLAYNRKFEFDLYSVLEALIFARCVNPCSKYRTFHEVVPYLFDHYDFSYPQMREAVEFTGSHYDKIVEIFTSRVNDRYSISTTNTYFDCTNFYFEIDRESDLQRKGPSKEKRTDPIVGLGLLLDANLLPIGMKIYPGNQSEKPVLRDIINDLKLQNQIVGKTVQVADKGLNCAANIYKAKKSKDGYIFSKSVKSLSGKEQKWVLIQDGYQKFTDSKGNLIYAHKSCVDHFQYKFVDEAGKSHSFKVREKRVSTYNEALAKKHIYEINKMVTKAQKLCLSQAKKSEYGESGKYVSFKSTNMDGELTDDAVATFLNHEAIEKALQLAGYNLLVTSEIEMEDQDIYNVYHNLWRIEQSFRIMKSELDARPVFVQKEDSIKGHFLICYLSVLLCRILEFKVLENKFCSEKIFDFIRNFDVLMIDNKKYINITPSSPLICHITSLYQLPYSCFNLSDSQIKMMLCKML